MIMMKKSLSKIDLKLAFPFLFIMTIIFSFIPQKHSLIGQWSLLLPDGTAIGEYLFFKEDSTYDITLPNGQIGERGMYYLKDSTFFIKNIIDGACGKDYWGKYSLAFYGNDSVHFALVEDTCAARRTDIVGFNPGIKRYITK
jgi:hypothetical protein